MIDFFLTEIPDPFEKLLQIVVKNIATADDLGDTINDVNPIPIRGLKSDPGILFHLLLYPKFSTRDSELRPFPGLNHPQTLAKEQIKGALAHFFLQLFNRNALFP